MELEFIPGIIGKRAMLRALELARQALLDGEVPVGAVIERHGQIIGEGRNRREALKSPLGHAEIEAIHSACQRLGDWRLYGCRMYVTLEPCPMCAGAAVNARLKGIVYGADDLAQGCCGSAMDVTRFLPGMQVYRGFMQEDAEEQLRLFFQQLREN